jgi:hypothetical protein
MSVAAVWGVSRPVELVRRLVRAGLMVALVYAVSGDVAQFGASKECGGAFSSAFSSGFDVRHCDLVIKRFGDEVGRLPLPGALD